MRLALKLAYYGSSFDSYARQPGKHTVEGELIDLLSTYNFITNAKEGMFRSASRTDKKVSALGNVIAFTTSRTQEEVYTQLPALSTDSLIIYGIACVEPDFYPRHARLRNYRYYFLKKDVDVSLLFSAASLFTGTHNFKNFARLEPGKNPVRSIDAIVISAYKEFYVIDFYAQTFLWNQIRRIISAFQRIALGKTTKERVQSALDNPGIRIEFGIAPPEPLVLRDVFYDFSFQHHPVLEKKIKKLEHLILQNL